MHIVLHLTSYVLPVVSLMVGQTLIPTKIKEAPIILGAIFSIFVARFEPAPNNDNLFTLFQWAIWSLACCRLIIYRRWSDKFVEYYPYWLLSSVQRHHSQFWLYILDDRSSRSSTSTFSHRSDISTYCWTLCQRSGCLRHNRLVLLRCCGGASQRVNEVFIEMLLLRCKWQWYNIRGKFSTFLHSKSAALPIFTVPVHISL